jgi:hypothetical protein
MTTTTCYAITRGEYSDYSVLAVYTTSELAEAELPKYHRSEHDRAQIKELPLDPEIPGPPPGMQGFFCVENNDGSILASPVTCYQMPAAYQIGVVNRSMYVWDLVAKGPLSRPWFNINVWARDEDHAIEIAAEKIAHQRAINADISLCEFCDEPAVLQNCRFWPVTQDDGVSGPFDLCRAHYDKKDDYSGSTGEEIFIRHPAKPASEGDYEG